MVANKENNNIKFYNPMEYSHFFRFFSEKTECKKCAEKDCSWWETLHITLNHSKFKINNFCPISDPSIWKRKCFLKWLDNLLQFQNLACWTFAKAREDLKYSNG